MDSSNRARFLRLCHRHHNPKWFLTLYGADVHAVNAQGENLLYWLLFVPRGLRRRLVPWALMLGWPADAVDEGRYPCRHSALYEACDCGRWEEVLVMLRLPLHREALESALYWACLAWWEDPLALRALRGLMAQLGGFCPEKLPQLLQLLIMGGVYPLIPEALAAGYTLPPDESPWWAGDEEAWSSSDERGNAAWRRALARFAAGFRPPAVPVTRLPKRPRSLKKKYRCQYSEREWLHLLRACC